jgi:beta-glucan synthesis-associated protein KRE6
VVHGLFDRLQRAVITAAAGNNKMSEVLLQWGLQLEILGLGMDHTLFVISSKFKLATHLIYGQYHPQQAAETVGRTNPRFSATPSEKYAPPPEQHPAPAALTTTTVPQYMWDKDPDLDDALHNPDPHGNFNFTIFSARGWMNGGAIFLLIVTLITLFIGYPLILHLTHLPRPIVGFNLGGINGSGQIPDLLGFPGLIDIDTPASALTRTGSDGNLYDLVFSDEFNIDGRTFYPGDDPYWEAVDLYYWYANSHKRFDNALT